MAIGEVSKEAELLESVELNLVGSLEMAGHLIMTHWPETAQSLWMSHRPELFELVKLYSGDAHEMAGLSAVALG